MSCRGSRSRAAEIPTRDRQRSLIFSPRSQAISTGSSATNSTFFSGSVTSGSLSGDILSPAPDVDVHGVVTLEADYKKGAIHAGKHILLVADPIPMLGLAARKSTRKTRQAVLL